MNLSAHVGRTLALATLLLGGIRCDSGFVPPEPPKVYIVSYYLTIDSTLSVDSLAFRSALGATVYATAPANNWSVVFSLASGDTLAATAWLTATGAGTATLEGTWTGSRGTQATNASAVATAPGALIVALPPRGLP